MAAVKKTRERMLPMAGGAPTPEDLEARQDEIRARVQEIDGQYAGQTLPDEARSEWNDLNVELEQNQTLVSELRARRQRVLELAEGTTAEGERSGGLDGFQTSSASATRGADIWDLSTLRLQPSEEALGREMRSRVLRAVDTAAFPDVVERSDAQAHIAGLLERFGGGEDISDQMTDFSRRILATGSPQYKRAFGKAVVGKPLTADESRALALGGTAQYAVPFTLDPTIIPTSNSSVNPYRSIARVETITGNIWEGVTSAGVTASYGAESAEVADGTPTLVQPSIQVEKAQAFVPFTIEASEDWGGMQGALAQMFSDAKDDLEAVKFTLGAGHGSTEPEGIIIGATTTVLSATGGALVAADIYGLEAALPARFRPRAQFVANRSTYQKIRQFDTSGGAQMWVQLGQKLEGSAPTSGNIGFQLLGFPANEATSIDSSIAKDKLFMVFGDFRYYVIVDRIGMNVEVVPHLFATGNNRPSGERGLYAYWRNSAEVVHPGAFRVLKGGA